LEFGPGNIACWCCPHILLAVRAAYVRKKGRGEKRKEEREGEKRKQKENWKKIKPETSQVK
jgi:hypothetical protein